MKNLSDHTDFHGELLTSLLMKGIQMGEICKLGWLVELVKHAIWAETLCFLCCLEYRAMDKVQKPSNLGHHNLCMLHKLYDVFYFLYISY
jgi:hypothetical protein